MPASAAPACPSTGFTGGFSIEATRPASGDLAAVAACAGHGRQIYLSAVPSKPVLELIATAVLARRAGLEPVVHLPARRFATTAELSNLLAALRGEADLRSVLAIAGDVETHGLYPDVLALIRSGELQRAGIENIGLAGYPEGHPRIATGRLEQALIDKIAASAAAGLRPHIVTQFAFTAGPVIHWLRVLRQQGVLLPVKVGIAGPTKLSTLLRYAKRCGVNTSIKGFMSGAAAGLIGNVGPDRIIDELSKAADLGDIALHYFSFGGIAETARYACEQAMRQTAEIHGMKATK